MAIHHFLMTILEVVTVERQPMKLFNVSNLRLESFARLWTYNDEIMFERIPRLVDDLLSQCHGIILDVGPGSGVLLRRFNPDNISVLYGAEPAARLHPALLENAKQAGFGDKYHALLCGGEPDSLIPALIHSGALQAWKEDEASGDGIFDEICCLRVLCGVPRPRETIKNLYSLLKPGGRMIICEHVVNPWQSKGSRAARLMQILYTIFGWPFFMGGCELQRNTSEYLKEAGDWAEFNLEYFRPKDVIPFVMGELVKKL